VPSKYPSDEEATERVYLYCKDLGIDENLVPRSKVYLNIDGVDTLIGDCQECETIQPEFYSSFEIPEKTISACGGWYAGSGDYYYTVLKGHSIEVYVKRPDEMDTAVVQWEILEYFRLE